MSPFLVHGIEWVITAVLAGVAGYLTSALRNSGSSASSASATIEAQVLYIKTSA